MIVNPIAKMLIDMARFYGYEIEKRQLQLYVDVLSQFPEDVVLQAGKDYVHDTKNTRFPIPPHKILEKYKPDERVLAIEAASRVIAAVAKFGWSNEGEARNYVGDLGWRAVERLGGWQLLCEGLGATLQISTVQAQIRDLCESTLRLGSAGVFDQPVGLPEKRDGELTNVGHVLKTLQGKTEETK